MSNTITSVDPVVIPARSEETVTDAVISRIRYNRSETESTLVVTVTPVDGSGNYLHDQSYTFKVSDATALLGRSPKLNEAWTDSVAMLAEVYKEKNIQWKIDSAAGADTTQLEADLAAATAAVEAPLS